MSVRERERKEKDRKGVENALLVKPGDLFLIKQKHQAVIVEESAVFSLLKPEQFASLQKHASTFVNFVFG